MDFELLITYLKEIPSVEESISQGLEDELWWAKFSIDINHPFAWKVVQELGHVLNYLSVEERLPTRFYPVSPPPYLNGGPEEFLSWVIESTAPDFPPDLAKQWLESRFPKPVNDPEQWE